MEVRIKMGRLTSRATRLALSAVTLGGIGILGAGAANAAANPATAHATGYRVVGHVYLDDNTKGTNTMARSTATPTARSHRWRGLPSPRAAREPVLAWLLRARSSSAAMGTI